MRLLPLRAPVPGGPDDRLTAPLTWPPSAATSRSWSAGSTATRSSTSTRPPPPAAAGAGGHGRLLPAPQRQRAPGRPHPGRGGRTSCSRRPARRLASASERATVFTKNVSEAINLVAYAWGLRNLRQGDEILVTEMEHHSNLVPWQLVATMTGARVRAGHRRLPARPGGHGRPAGRADPDGGRVGHVERARHRQPGGRDRRAGPCRRGAGPGRRRPGRAPRRGASGHPRGRLRLHRPQGPRPDGVGCWPPARSWSRWSRSLAGAR